MTQAFFLGQLRLMAVALLSYGAGAHWFTSETAGLLTAIMIPAGLLFGPWLWSIYANVNMKLVPQNSIAIQPITMGASQVSIGDHVNVDTGSGLSSGAAKVVGALLLALILSSFAFDPANAQPAASPGACNIQTLFQGLAPGNFITRLKTCGVADFQTALADAQSSPVDNGALACLIPATALVQAIADSQSGNGGLVTAFQKFRRAKQSGIVGACTAYVNSTILLQ